MLCHRLPGRQSSHGQSCSLACEVTRVGISHLNADFVCLERSVGTFQLSTVIKHIFIINFMTSFPVAVAENSGQGRTAIEHVSHVADFFGVKVAHINRCQCLAAGEHAEHIGDVFCVEVAYIERCHCLTSPEHAAHVCDVFGVKVAYIKRCQCLAALEHQAHVGDVLGIEVA